MAHPDSREGSRISRFRPQMSSFHPPRISIFKPGPARLQRLSGTPADAWTERRLSPSYIPMTMIEKLAMNMAMEVKAARSRMKSVIGRLLFRYVLTMFYLCSLVKKQPQIFGHEQPGW
jgi:hypothetical protein